MVDANERGLGRRYFKGQHCRRHALNTACDPGKRPPAHSPNNILPSEDSADTGQLDAVYLSWHDIHTTVQRGNRT